MEIRFKCPSGHQLKAKKSQAGRQFRCPACNCKVTVPRPEVTSDSNDKKKKVHRSPAPSPPSEAVSQTPPIVPRNIENSPLPPPPLEEDSTPVDPTREAVVYGYEPEDSIKKSAMILGGMIVACAIVGLVPSVQEVLLHWTTPASPGVGLWAFVALPIAIVQCGFALFLAQVPDRASAVVCTVATAAVATVYAIGLGLASMADVSNPIIFSLDLAVLHQAGRVSLWMLIMLCLNSTLAYFLLRATLHWRHVHDVLFGE